MSFFFILDVKKVLQNLVFRERKTGPYHMKQNKWKSSGGTPKPIYYWTNIQTPRVIMCISSGGQHGTRPADID